jgi:hypothetical protein
MRTCDIEGCERKHYARGWCSPHYHQWRRTDDPISKARPSAIDRLMPRVVVVDRGHETPCWEPDYVKNGAGYAQMGDMQGSGRSVEFCHRVTYRAFMGPIPDGMEIDHLCRNPPCCNPDHLEAVTHRENILRSTSPLAAHARKTHCIRGHEFTPENTVTRTRPGGTGRDCRACSRARGRARRRRESAVA